MDLTYRKIKKPLWYFLIINFVLLVFIIYQLFYSRYYWEGEYEKRFSIPKGEILGNIAERLKADGIIANTFLFKLAVRLTGKEEQIISKHYLLKNGMSTSELISILTDKSSTGIIRITIPPGYNIRQIARLVENKLLLSSKIFLHETTNDSLINILGLKDSVKNLEGFLFPDSYEIPDYFTEKDLVNLLFNEFRERVSDNPEVSELLIQRGRSLLQTITLASIISGETKLESEKPTIAGVYLNRIRKGMRLEADPTVQYVIPDGPKSRLLYEDLKFDSPYNTYLYKGLPPGPINNPGMTSIMAALNPQDHEYIFFVATGEGGHKFTKNYSDHLKASSEYRKKMREKRDSIKK